MADVRTPQQIVQDEAGRLGLEPALALALIEQESGFDPQAKSPTGVQGLAQVTNTTGAAYGQTPQTRTDPVVSTRAGLSYFKDLLTQEGGNIPAALTRYNGGTDPNFAQNVLNRYPKHAANQAAADYQRLMGTSEAAPDGKADYERLMGSPAGTPAPADTGQFPKVVPNPDPTQPATVEYPGTSPATSAPRPPSPASDLTIDIVKDSPASARRLTPEMTDEELLTAIGVDPALVMQSRYYQPGMFGKSLVTPGSAGESLTRSWVGDVMHGVRQPLDAGAQMLTRGLEKIGLTSKADIALTDAMIKLKQAEYQQTARPTAVDLPLVGETNVGSLAGTMMVPLPGTRGVLPAGTSTVGRIATGTTNGAVAGTVAGIAQPVMEPGTPDTANDTFWQQKLEQGKTGALVGGGTGTLTSTAGAVGNKTVNAARNLSPRYAQVEEALNAATGQDGTVNERIFTAVLNSTPGAKFAGQEKWEVDGLKKLMEHIQNTSDKLTKAGQWLQTGAIILPGTLTRAGFTAVKLAKMLYSTPQGRNFLLAASDLQPGSDAMSRLVERIGSQLPRLMATEATEPNAPASAR